MIFIGWSEKLGGVGMILPAALKIKPILTPLAAAGLTLIMILATGFHIMRGEYSLMVLTIVLGAMTGFVAYGRWKLKPIKS